MAPAPMISISISLLACLIAEKTAWPHSWLQREKTGTGDDEHRFFTAKRFFI
jgi:hypothetical protein